MPPLVRETPAFDLDAYVTRCGGLDLSAIAWDEVPRYPLARKPSGLFATATSGSSMARVARSARR
jgi:hypothetical protein